MLILLKKLFPWFMGIIMISGITITMIYKQNINNYFRIKQNIVFDLPVNYVKREIEDHLFKVLNDVSIQGVHVLYEPKESGKTTAIKKLLIDMQNSDTKYNLTIYDKKNIKFNKTITLLPVYVDAGQWKNIDYNLNKNLESIQKKWNNLLNKMPVNTKAVIVLDHISKDIIDGFSTWYEPKLAKKATSFFSFFATSSYKSDYKFVIICVTNDKQYAVNILKCNGFTKIHQISTASDPEKQMYADASLESLTDLQKFLAESIISKSVFVKHNTISIKP